MTSKTKTHVKKGMESVYVDYVSVDGKNKKKSSEGKVAPPRFWALLVVYVLLLNLSLFMEAGEYPVFGILGIQ